MSSIDTRIARLAASQYGVFAAWQLRDEVSSSALARRVADDRLKRLHRGVFAVGHAWVPLRGRWMAAVLAHGQDAVLSHHDGAALLDLIRPRSGRVHVTVPAGRRPQRGIRAHVGLLEARDRTVVDRIPVTSVARTLLDLAPVVDAHALQRLWERAEKLQSLDVRAVEDVLARANGRRGVRSLRALLSYDPTAAAGAESELERLFLDLIREAGLPRPQMNVLVEGFLVDAYWPEARLVVELDGYEFHSGREAFEGDHRRTTSLLLAGYRCLRFTYRQVVDEPETVLEAVRRELLGWFTRLLRPCRS